MKSQSILIIRVNLRRSDRSPLAMDTNAETRFSERTADGVHDKISGDQPRQLRTEDRRFVGLSLLSGNYSHLNLCG
jgi:hypothetical protein